MLKIDLNLFQETALWSKLPDGVVDEDFGRTVSSHQFPGALLPSFSGESRVVWYAIAGDAPTWRKLRPLLMAYVGETVTTFNGEPHDLSTANPIEKLILSTGAYAAAKLHAPNGNHLFPLRALSRMIRSLEEKPTDIRPPPMSTAMMIAHFDMCLIQGDRTGAENCLMRLRSELRLDALNLIFAEIRLNAAFRDWSSILGASWFAEVCRVKKPPTVAIHLLEAIWHSDLESCSDDPDILLENFNDRWRDATNTILGSIPENYGNLEARFRSLHFRKGTSDQNWPGIDSEPSETEILEDTEKGHDIQQNGSAAASSTADREVGQTTQVPSLSDTADLNQTSKIAPVDWVVWLGTLADPANRHFMDTAREVGDTRNASTYEDPLEIDTLSTALIEIRDGFVQDRLVSALPTILSWARKDGDYPRKTMKPIYETLLTLITLVDDYGTAEREAASELLSALLNIGVSENHYRQLMQDVSSFVPDGAGRSDVYWLLDLADLVSQRSAIDENSRNSLLNQILGSLSPVTKLLTPIQSKVYQRLSKICGWLPPTEPASRQEEENIDNKLDGKLVAIYTLTERAGRQAAKTLKQMVPNVNVEISSDHVSTQRLKNLAKNADIFVVTTSSAKHAATDCIGQNRASKDILFATGKGYCSILRSIEESL